LTMRTHFEHEQGESQVLIDSLLFRLVVSNLVDNAVKFTPANGEVDVRLEFLANSRGMALTVSDTGPGIPAEHMGKLFDRFYRVDPARQKSTGGAGLGLAIAKEVCEKTGGNITVENRPRGGAVFRAIWQDP
jgi:signal transduction histidine kinase